MLQYYICATIIILFFILLTGEIIKTLNKTDNAINRIVICIVLTFLFKFNYGIEFFGLEYEDAYAFSFCARQFSYGIFPSSFLIDAISIGSLSEPISTSTYGGHFITYPVYISLFTNTLSWSPSVIDFANTFIAFLILIILSLFPNNNNFWYIAPISYCISPIINIFTTCHLSELFSSFICLVFLYTYLNMKNKYTFSLCIVSFLLSLMCKRENIALLLIIILDFIFLHKQFISHKKYLLISSLKFIPFIIITCIYLLFIQNIFNIEEIESHDIENNTFSISYFSKLFPVFTKSILNFNLFSITFIGTLIWIFSSLKNKDIKKYNIILPALLFCLYLILYSAHYRGYYFVKEMQASAFETFRYINNFYYLLPVILAQFRFKFPHFIKIASIFLLTISFYNTNNLRNSMSDLEFQKRFKEALQIKKHIEYYSSDSFLICENILIYQNLCSDKFKICDIRLINKLTKNNNTDYYLLIKDNKYLKERYNLEIDMNKFKPVLLLDNNNYLYKYSWK